MSTERSKQSIRDTQELYEGLESEAKSYLNKLALKEFEKPIKYRRTPERLLVRTQNFFR